MKELLQDLHFCIHQEHIAQQTYNNEWIFSFVLMPEISVYVGYITMFYNS